MWGGHISVMVCEGFFGICFIFFFHGFVFFEVVFCCWFCGCCVCGVFLVYTNTAVIQYQNK